MVIRHAKLSWTVSTLLICLLQCSVSFAFNLLDWSFCWYPPYPNTIKMIPVYINPNYNPNIISLDDQIAGICAAINTWNQSLETEGASIRLDYRGICEVNEFTYNNQCDIFFDDTDQPQELLAHTQKFLFEDHEEDNCESDIAIYTRYNTYGWVEVPYPGWPPGNIYDLQTVVLHELGHVFGLAHVDDPVPVMYNYYTGVKRVLNNDDKYGIFTIYMCYLSDVLTLLQIPKPKIRNLA